jgi:hypothetical protein
MVQCGDGAGLVSARRAYTGYPYWAAGHSCDSGGLVQCQQQCIALEHYHCRSCKVTVGTIDTVVDYLAGASMCMRERKPVQCSFTAVSTFKQAVSCRAVCCMPRLAAITLTSRGSCSQQLELVLQSSSVSSARPWRANSIWQQLTASHWPSLHQLTPISLYVLDSQSHSCKAETAAAVQLGGNLTTLTHTDCTSSRYLDFRLVMLLAAA